MLSDQSRQGLANALTRAATSTLARSPADHCEIAPATAEQDGGSPSDRLLVITISSFAFRLLTIFHVGDTDANRGYFMPQGGDSTLYEGFAEAANLCCGALNREISCHLPHLAMSSPYMLNRGCMEHLPQLNSEYTAHFLVTINDSVKVMVTLCMCCSATVDIPVNGSEVGQSAGELEMF